MELFGNYYNPLGSRNPYRNIALMENLLCSGNSIEFVLEHTILLPKLDNLGTDLVGPVTTSRVMAVKDYNNYGGLYSGKYLGI
jgi:hypothetical protein